MLRFLWRRLRSYLKRPRQAQKVDADDDLEWLLPPRDMHDASAWDSYWNDQVMHCLGPPLFDMFCLGDDEVLIQAMLQFEMRTVLCAGSGISQEPRALAEAGFEVTALDLSPVAAQLAQAWRFDRDDLPQYFDPKLRRPRGRVEFVVGDLLDPKICPGPFDVVIERRTLQLFPPHERGRALDALAARLHTEGIFISQCHDAAWRPPAPRVHMLEDLFLERGWALWEWWREPKPKGRVAWLTVTTG